MTLGEALKVVSDILDSQYLSPEGLQAKAVIQNAIDENLEELIEEAVTLLTQVPKEMNQELAIALTQIVEGGE